ncbi:MAG: C39 family peptidase [Gammaproteobacteria bacterium]|nr:C39 family peptidase [Gammaproteobacteria bacterium]
MRSVKTIIGHLNGTSRAALSLIVFSALFLAPNAQAGAVWLPGIGGGDNVSVKSIKERKFEQVVRQQYDFSCGSAALATLLTYHYENPIDEQTAFDYMYENGDPEKIKRAGFSLLDMKSYLEGNGYKADGFEATLDTVAEASVPAITLLNVRGYRHFVVVKGVTDDEVLVGDPALGLKFFDRDEFEAMWGNGILFIITSEVEVGKKYFNSEKAWQTLARAPLGRAVSHESLSSLTVAIPRPNEF